MIDKTKQNCIKVVFLFLSSTIRGKRRDFVRHFKSLFCKPKTQNTVWSVRHFMHLPLCFPSRPRTPSEQTCDSFFVCDPWVWSHSKGLLYSLYTVRVCMSNSIKFNSCLLIGQWRLLPSQHIAHSAKSVPVHHLACFLSANRACFFSYIMAQY